MIDSASLLQSLSMAQVNGLLVMALTALMARGLATLTDGELLLEVRAEQMTLHSA